MAKNRIFNKISYRFQATILIILSVSLFFSTWIAYNRVSTTVISDYQELSEKYIRQSNSTAKLYMNLIEETTRYASQGSRFQNFLGSDISTSSIIFILDSIQVTNLNILGTTMYRLDGSRTVSSSSTVIIPTITWILNNEIPESFLLSNDLESIWLLRHKCCEYFYKNYSNKDQGILTYIKKIYDVNGFPIALLLVDTDIRKIHEIYSVNSVLFNSLSTHLYQDQFISSQGELDENVSTNITQLIEGNRPSPTLLTDICLIKSDDNPLRESAIIIAYSMNNINQQLRTVRNQLIIICLAFFIAFALLSKQLVNSIVNPLSQLQHKMRSALK